MTFNWCKVRQRGPTASPATSLETFSPPAGLRLTVPVSVTGSRADSRPDQIAIAPGSTVDNLSCEASDKIVHHGDNETRPVNAYVNYIIKY